MVDVTASISALSRGHRKWGILQVPHRLAIGAYKSINPSVAGGGEGDAQERIEGLLDELQLALYARAWEIAHPGDLVVASGISTLGHNTEHILEISSGSSAPHENLKLGERTTTTALLHRFTDEPPSPESDHFRAWLAQRLGVALRVAAGAAAGRVHPTPSPVCRYCPVSNACEVKMEVGF